MALLHVLAALRREQGLELRALTIDHLSRAKSSRDVQFCRQQCECLQIPFSSLQIPEKISSNREHRWRQEREQIFKALLAPGDVLYQGHHLNDSWEWYLMGQLKSSSRYIAGIPLINGHLRRPFLCVSKSQIIRYAREQSIPFVRDLSNRDEQFERNSLRKSTASWERRFPKYLKHYAQRQNDWAYQQSLHALKQSGSFHYLQDQFGGQLFWSWKKLGGAALKQALIQGICKLSSQGRGQLSKEVEKLITAQKRGNRLGPMAFSGGVFAYWGHHIIYLLNQNGRKLREVKRKNLRPQWKMYHGLPDFKASYVRDAQFLTFPIYIAHSKIKGMVLPPHHPLYAPYMDHSLTQKAGFWASPLHLIQSNQRICWPLQVLEFKY